MRNYLRLGAQTHARETNGTVAQYSRMASVQTSGFLITRRDCGSRENAPLDRYGIDLRTAREFTCARGTCGVIQGYHKYSE